MTTSRLLPIALASLALATGALTMGCQTARADLRAASRSQVNAAAAAAAAQPAQVAAAAPVQNAPTPVQAAPVAAAAPSSASAPMFQEQGLDTGSAGTPAPGGVVLSTHNLKISKVKTPSDEKLPKWVPVKGRLSVVDSSDLAENLGLVPKGATKKSEQPISVADKLAEESAARKSDPMTQGSSWSYAKAGKVRSRR